MRINLNDDMISVLRGYRARPGRVEQTYSRYFMDLGLVEQCPNRDTKTTKTEILKAYRQLTAIYKRLPVLTQANVRTISKGEEWYPLSQSASRIANHLIALRQPGYQLTTRGYQLLKDIDAAINAAKWTVSAKDATIDIQIGGSL